MENTSKHWKNIVEPIDAVSIVELTDKLNAFYEGKFVIATQTFFKYVGMKEVWKAIVYYKVAPAK